MVDSSSSGIPSTQDQGVPIEDVPARADSGISILVAVGAGSASSSPSVQHLFESALGDLY